MKKITAIVILFLCIAAVFVIWNRIKVSWQGAPSQPVGLQATSSTSHSLSHQRAISAGLDHILALNTQGDIYGWGSNAKMQLGIPKNHSIPIPKPLASHGNWKYIHAGYMSSYAITEYGILWRRPYDRSLYRVRISPIQSINISAGEYHKEQIPYRVFFSEISWNKVRESLGVAAGIDSTGRMWVWRERRYSSVEGHDKNPNEIIKLVAVGKNKQWLDFCIGKEKFYAIATDGSLWKHGRLADLLKKMTREDNATHTEKKLDLISVSTPAAPQRIICREGTDHTLALDRHGQLWGFGQNTVGELGNGDGSPYTKTTAVSEQKMQKLNNKHWHDIAIGPGFSLGITTDGNLWAWGINSRGQLGLGDFKSHDIPTLVDNKRKWVTVTAGQNFSAGLTKNGEIYAWGSNVSGTLGSGSTAGFGFIPSRVFEGQRWGTQ